MLRLDWKTASIFVWEDPDWQRKIFIGGLWLFLPFGWLIALGYRKEVVMNLVWSHHPVLPDWKGKAGYFLLEGFKAMAVILFYFSPWFVCLWLCALWTLDCVNVEI